MKIAFPACVVLLAPLALAQDARFVPLGFNGGGTYSSASDLSADGSVIIGTGIDENLSDDRVLRWRVASQGEVITHAGPSFGAAYAFVTDATGSALTGAVFEIEYSTAFVWSESQGWTWTPPSGSGFISPRGMSDSGNVLMTAADDTYGGRTTWIGSLSGFTSIGDLPGQAEVTEGYALSGDGEVVVGQASNGFYWEAFRWEAATGVIPLGLAHANHSRSSALATNSDGSVIVGWSGASFDHRAMRWTAADGMRLLGALPGDVESTASGVSGDGSVVIGRSGEDELAFVWTAATGTVAFSDVLVNEAAGCLQGWSDFSLAAISSDGNAICGSALNPSGQVEAFVFYFAAPDFIELGERLCSPAIPNSSGASASLSVVGSSCVTDADVELNAAGLPANRFGYFLASTSSDLVLNPGGSQGNLCLGQPFGRFAAAIQSSGPAGELSLTLDLASIPQVGAVATGDTLFFQAWFRDVNPMNTSNFTDVPAVEFR